MVFMMDNITSKDGHFDVDLEKGIISDELGSNSIGGFHFGPIRMNQSQTEGVNGGVVNCNVNLMVVDKKEGEEKGGDVKKPKAISAKKPPKPPRPPRGLSLDSADLKLIRELHELAKLKRARIERMKALKKAKEAKTSSSSKNHVFGTLLTVLFCLVLLFQGISSRTNSAVKFQGSPFSSEATKDNVISIQHLPSSSASNVYKPGSEFPRRVELVSGSGFDAPEQGSTAVD